ncbi:hypothetical protein P153DRAFT_430850 [Dothidotthia symphoricarpi CBS 119687]|uniref:Zn(2)-C6 fungal-type domain-containing protein n=1 Tax=Dothidotthia symphoricarpi CBS 119687 TaxID=1392245 RepID=A0A6A6AD86_9PLEO|nr:uncharacterized protein P153DRAFT_430850 [Dothidotthia symphoricarpi CBS 119687]KAF2129730.1 hypothetical protein P153DRAFT_430850 [Dothidotthia symphoricarpi CBS 119687]
MFGTLISDNQRKESLTFVRNTDTASALSRSRRDKPHASCQLCRARKIRCSGQASGCDRCASIGVECWYPDRPTRRKKRTASLVFDTSGAVDDSTSCSPALRDNGTKNEQEQDLEEREKQTEDHIDIGKMQQNDYLSSYHEGNSSKSTREGWDEWIDMDGPPHPMLTDQLEDPLGPMDSMSDTVWNSLFGDACGHIGFESIDLSSLDNSILCPEDPAKTLMPPPYNLSPQLRLDTPSILRSSPTPSNRNIDENNTQRQFEYLNDINSVSSEFPDTRNISQHAPKPVFRPTLNTCETVSPGSPTSSSSMNSPCRCRQLTAQLFKTFCYESTSNDRVAMDALLRYFRSTLEQYTQILFCERCADIDEYNMLLAMAGQYMSVICERTVLCYVRLRCGTQQQQGNQPQLSTSLLEKQVSHTSKWSKDENENERERSTNDLDVRVDNEMVGDGGVWFSTYRITSNLLQLEELLQLLTKLKKRTSNQSRFILMLAEAENRIQTTQLLVKVET